MGSRSPERGSDEVTRRGRDRDGAPVLYLQAHVEKGDEPFGLFRGLVERDGVSRALHPGCYVHVTPPFVIPTVVYADSDKRAARFFVDPETLEFVRRNREYERKPGTV